MGKPCKTVRACMAQTDIPFRVDIRADYTSDGTYQGLGLGRIEAERRATNLTPGGWLPLLTTCTKKPLPSLRG